jgi:hypothetical protein
MPSTCAWMQNSGNKGIEEKDPNLQKTNERYWRGSR